MCQRKNESAGYKSGTLSFLNEPKKAKRDLIWATKHISCLFTNYTVNKLNKQKSQLIMLEG